MLSSLACMAVAIYFEARSEPLAGQLAVANVVMNRVWDERYPNDVCEVITQGRLGSKPTDILFTVMANQMILRMRKRLISQLILQAMYLQGYG